MPAIIIAIRNGNTGAITPAASAADVLAAIAGGDDILFNGQTAVLTNMGGQWLVQGQPVATWFPTIPAIPPPPAPPVIQPPATGPTVAPPDGSTGVLPGSGVTPTGTGPTIVYPPIMRIDPTNPIAAVADMQWSDLVPWIVGGIVLYFLFSGRRS